ncbi:MAG: relaxase/mobilization nuclease domain-containing protein [Faecalibacterium prausnitzii]
MATTYLKAHHISRGETIAQSMKDRFDCGQNPDKTEQGELIMAYECDSRTADAEFLLTKARYKVITGREQKRDADVLCYQIRQSFPPGEIDHREALKISYELAMRWTKGKHAFFVVSHTDRPHPHCHIYFNSTSLDCTRKYRDFLGSARALRKLSDRVCIEHGLSVIQNPKLKSQGRYRHYGQWLGADKPLTHQEKLKLQIDLVLAEGPADFSDFLRRMETAGYEVKEQRGAISFRAPGQERFTRLRAETLGAGYGPEDIRAALSGKGRTTPRRKISLAIDIQARMQTGKGPGYERWAKVFNVKQMAQTYNYLREHGLLNYAELEEKAAAATAQFHALSAQIKAAETRMAEIAVLKTHIINYAKTRDVYAGYRKAGYSKKYLAEHESDILLHKAAKNAFDELGVKKLPTVKSLQEEYAKLLAEKKAAYAEYRRSRDEMRELLLHKQNVDRMLGKNEREEEKKKEHDRQ